MMYGDFQALSSGYSSDIKLQRQNRSISFAPRSRLVAIVVTGFVNLYEAPRVKDMSFMKFPSLKFRNFYYFKSHFPVFLLALHVSDPYARFARLNAINIY